MALLVAFAFFFFVSFCSASLTKEYTYRALKDNTDLSANFTALKYGYANLTLSFNDDFSLSGEITGFVNETTSGLKWVLNVTGNFTLNKQSIPLVVLNMEATGPVQGLTWVYRYIGVSMPVWSVSSPDQQHRTFVGTVVRIVGHGHAPAGEAASWYAVEKTDDSNKKIAFMRQVEHQMSWLKAFL